MSLLFRSRAPRKLPRKSVRKALSKTPVPSPSLGSDPMPATLPGPRAEPAPVRHTPGKRGQRTNGYGTTDAPSQRRFRVT